MDVRSVHEWKAYEPIVFILLGRIIELRCAHDLKAPSLMVTRPSGRVIDSRSESSNRELLNSVIVVPSSKMTDLRADRWNACCSISTMLAGMVIDSIPVPLKAFCLIILKLSGSVIDLRLEVLANALMPILLKLSEKLMLMRLEKLLKA